MAFSQPQLSDLVIQAKWDGIPSHALELEISFEVDAPPNASLRLISEEVMCRVNIMNAHGLETVPVLPTTTNTLSENNTEKATVGSPRISRPCRIPLPASPRKQPVTPTECPPQIVPLLRLDTGMATSKVKHWLEENSGLSEDCASAENKSTWAHNCGQLSKFPPGPCESIPNPSASPPRPWMQRRHRNPLQLRGGMADLDYKLETEQSNGLSNRMLGVSFATPAETSVQKLDGFVYAVFHDEGRHFVHIQGRVQLRKDVLEIPGLPTETAVKGRFSLLIANNEDDKMFEKIAYINPVSGDKEVFQNDKLELPMDGGIPFSVKLIRFQANRLLGPTDFEVDYDIEESVHVIEPGIKMISVKHRVSCSLRLTDSGFWADTIQFTILLDGVEDPGTLQFYVGTEKHRMHSCRQKQDKAGQELEIELIMKVEDMAKALIFIFHTTAIAPIKRWVPRIFSTSQTTATRNHDSRDVALPEDEDGNTNIRDVQARSKPAEWTRSITGRRYSLWDTMKWFGLLYLLIHRLATTESGSKIIQHITTRIMDDVTALRAEHVLYHDEFTNWKFPVAEMKGPSTEEETVTVVRTVTEEQEQDTIFEAVGEAEQDSGVQKVAAVEQEFWLDKIDRLLGWKGPNGNW